MRNYKKQHYELFFLILILAGAFILRLWGVNFGLPGLFHLDERIFPVDAFYRLSHKGQIPFVHHSYPYGDLIPNMLAVFYGIYYLILKLIKIVHTPFDFLVFYIRNPSSVYLIGRMLFVLSSTASVFVLYLIGKRLCNKTVGFLSAFFLAFNFLSVQQAKFMKGDTLGTLLMLISVYFCFPQKDEEDVNGQIKHKKYILTGIFAGLAIAARFTLVVYLIVPVIVFLMDKKILFANKIKNCLIFILCSISTFLILTPSVIFRCYIFFINMLSLGIQVGEASKSINSNSAWMIHMDNGIGIPLAIIGILGMLYSLYKKENISLIVFVVLFGSAVFNLATPSWHAIAIIPFIVFFAAKFIYEISIIICKKKPKTRHFFLAVVSILVVIPPLLNVLKYNYLISCPDTRNLAKEFIEKTIPPGSKIVSEGMEYFEQTSILGVPINKSKKQLQEQFDKVKKEGFGGALVLAEIKGQKEPSYTLENILILEDPPYKNEKYDTTVEIYLEHNIDYLIMSSWVRDCSWNYSKYIMPEKFAISLEKEYEIIKEFKPNPVFDWDYYCFSKIDYNALSKVAIWHRKIIGGPIIKIYKKRISPLPICQTDRK